MTSSALPFARPCLAVLAALLLLGSTPALPGGDDRRRSPGPRDEAMPGVVVVRFADASAASKAGAYAPGRLPDGAALRDLAPAFPFVAHAASKAGRAARALEALRDVYYLRFDGAASPFDVSAALADAPGVVYAEPLYVHRLTGRVEPHAGTGAARVTTPNDPRFPDMTYLGAVEAAAAWDEVKGEEGDVVIAVVDGGVDWQHVDLRDNVWTNPGEVPDNGVDDDANGFVDDVHGWSFTSDSPNVIGRRSQNLEHGTIVASVAAAATDNALGMSSLSWNARFMPVRTSCPDLDGFICFGYPGVLYAALAGADIVNVSWSGTFRSFLAEDVIQTVHALGVLVVAASANGGDDGVGDNIDASPMYPASYPGVLAVGATERDRDAKARFSNYGRRVDVFAPGVGITAALPSNDYTDFAVGTSFSTPMVAALAALVMTRHPGLTADQVREQIRNTADAIDGLNAGLSGRLGRGRINARRALTETGQPAVRLVDVAFEDDPGDGELERGETVTARARLTNYLVDAPGPVRLRLTTGDPFVALVSDAAELPGLASGDTAEVAFTFFLHPMTPDEHSAVFALEIETGGRKNTDFFDAFTNPAVYLTIDTGVLRTAMTLQGNLGWTGFDGARDPRSRGEGFVYEGRNRLYEAGLIVASSAARISDAVRGENTEVQHDDFLKVSEGLPQIVRSGALAGLEASISYSDARAATPLGVVVEEAVYADSAGANRDFVVVHYRLTNRSGGPIPRLYAGLFFDWDLTDGLTDYARWDADRRMGIVQDDAESPGVLMATRLLTAYPGWSYRAISNEDELFDGFSDAEKWRFLHEGVQHTERDAEDVSTLLGAGPFSFKDDCSVDVAFALLGAGSPAELADRSDRAADFWTTHFPPPPPNRAPVFTSVLVDTTVAEAETLTYTFAAEDPDGCDALTYQLVKPLSNAAIEAQSGVLTFTPNYDQMGVFDVDVRVTDGLLSDTLRVRFRVTDTNRAPLFTRVLNQERIRGGQTFVFRYEGQDPDGDAVVFSLENPPHGARIDAQTGVFTYETTMEQAGDVPIVAVLSDGVGKARVETILTVEATTFALDPVFPNPAQPPVDLRFRLSGRSRVVLEVFDVLGRRVRRLAAGERPEGAHVVTWDGTDEARRPVTPGVYFYRLVAASEHGSYERTRQLVVLR